VQVLLLEEPEQEKEGDESKRGVSTGTSLTNFVDEK
jgi:hypothetical protein